MTAVCEKEDQQSVLMDSGLKSDVFPNSVKHVEDSAEDGIPSHSTSSMLDAASSIKGYNGGYGQFDDSGFFDAGGGSPMGIQADQSSVPFYMPGYEPYASGCFSSGVGQCNGELSYCTSSGYNQQPLYYRAKTVPCNSGNASPGTAKSGPSRCAGLRTNGFKYATENGSATHSPSLTSNSNSCQPFVASNIQQPTFRHQAHKTLKKVPPPGYNFQSARHMKAYSNVGNISSFRSHKHDPTQNNGPAGYRPKSRIWNDNDRFELKEKSKRNNECEISANVACGPRADNRNGSSYSSSVKEQLGSSLLKGRYNLPEFQTQYGSAKFYIIKSYSEDDIHKCIKYDVWSSTPYGNKKLDAAFHDAGAKTSDVGLKCPIFLFFSVNGSGQFVGLAEMIGKVDFNKNMDFWQLDGWNGFFPVKWHIIKDIPNGQLWHILLENNDKRSVTYTRDTQEITLKPGLEMLKIFKNFSAKTSLLDDFDFYEAREKAKAKSKSLAYQMQLCGSELPMHLESEIGYGEEFINTNMGPDAASSLVSHAKSLSINSP
ncbi:YTH domain-containing protein [Ancistrocladus abbreviatus]